MRFAGPSKLPPGPALPAAAQTFLFWRWPFTYLEYCRDRYGSHFTLSVTSRPPLIFLSDPTDINAVITAPAHLLHPGCGADTIEPLVGARSFMLEEEDQHLSGRRAILPAFHHKVIQEHAEFVSGVVWRALASWPRNANFALHPSLRALTLEVILGTVFGASNVTSDERLHMLRDHLLMMLEVTASPVFPEPLLRHGPGRSIWQRFLHRRAQADQIIFALIDERTRTAPANDLLSANDALGRLLRARNPDGSPISRRQIRDNLMSIILAGHETTASELAWAFQLLAHNPIALSKLVAEIDHDSTDEYLTATVHEVLRHRPVFLFTIPRSVAQPIEVAGWTHSPPVRLLGCIYLLHHDPSLYAHPHRFCPERFLGISDEPAGTQVARSSPDPYTWLPWGGGRRRCPGLHVATLELKTVLRTVLSQLTLHPAAKHIEHPRWRSVIVTPHAGSRVLLRARPPKDGARARTSDALLGKGSHQRQN
jgi:cytochrome P450